MPRMGFESLLDDAFRALAHDIRRRVLFRLMGPEPEISVPEEIHVGDRESAELDMILRHHHLPLLEDLELITWDEDARTVGKGMKFEAVRPMLQLLDEHLANVAGDQFGRGGIGNP